MSDQSNRTLHPDAPIENPEEDRFDRAPFARKVAETIIRNTDPSNLVIGIYGAWGEGKTTVLNFIKKNLEEISAQEQKPVVVVTFNPWRYGTEDDLLKSLYDAIALTLQATIHERHEKAGSFLKRFTWLADLIDKGDALERGANALLESATTENYKQRIENVLADTSIRVVVFMDDIDRLEHAEIQAIFRIIKLSLDLKNTCYILAFDEEMVARAIAERFANDIESGRSFLEKIVQVPLQLPNAGHDAMHRFFKESLERALQTSHVTLAENELADFERVYLKSLAPMINTPRVIKRYTNALLFALSILKDEVNYVDLMLIEGMRLCYPRLYDIVAANPNVFSRALLPFNVMDFALNKEEMKEEAENLLKPGLCGLDGRQRRAAEQLLFTLFPPAAYAIRGIRNNQDAQVFDREKRAASPFYFDRYFSYTVRKGEISEHSFSDFLSRLDQMSLGEVAQELTLLISKYGPNKIAFMLSNKLEGLPDYNSRKLVAILSQNGDWFPKKDVPFGRDTYRSILDIIIDLLRNTDPSERRAVAQMVIESGQPLSFAFDCFQRMRTQNQYRGDEPVLTEEDEASLTEVMLSRLIEHLDAESSFDPEYIGKYLYFWARYRSKDVTSSYIKQALQEAPEAVIGLIRGFRSRHLGDDDINKDTFNDDSYTSLSNVVDTDFIHSVIQEHLTSNTLTHLNLLPIDEKFISQFTALHLAQTDSTTPYRVALLPNDSSVDDAENGTDALDTSAN